MNLSSHMLNTMVSDNTTQWHQNSQKNAQSVLLTINKQQSIIRDTAAMQLVSRVQKHVHVNWSWTHHAHHDTILSTHAADPWKAQEHASMKSTPPNIKKPCTSLKQKRKRYQRRKTENKAHKTTQCPDKHKTTTLKKKTRRNTKQSEELVPISGPKSGTPHWKWKTVRPFSGPQKQTKKQKLWTAPSTSPSNQKQKTSIHKTDETRRQMTTNAPFEWLLDAIALTLLPCNMNVHEAYASPMGGLWEAYERPIRGLSKPMKNLREAYERPMRRLARPRFVVFR